MAITLNNTTNRISGEEFLMAEQAAVSSAPGAGNGTIWVKDDTPNTLYFTDDAGTDFNLLAGGGTPGGATTQIQYNNAGAFGGDSGFTTNGTGAVNIVGDLDVDNININGNTIISTDTNGAIIITPNGNGALQSDSGGNTRGTDAVDFQSNRSTATQVASGTRSFIAGGTDNTASGTDSCASGSATVASGTASSTFGTSCTASTSHTQASGERAVANKYAQFSRASGRFTVDGDAQFSLFTARNSTTDATQTELFLNGTSSRITIATDTTWAFSVLIGARRTDADDESAAYKIEGCIDNNAGTTALVGSILKTIIAEDSVAWDVTVEADNTNDALVVRVTGEAAKTIRWVCRVDLVEITG